jgi:uncharacterized protein
MRMILRGALLCAALLAVRPVPVPAAEELLELGWEQLIPPGAEPSSPTPRGIVRHGQISPAPDAARNDAALVTGYDGRRVRIAGYVVPLGFDGVGVREFLLVPYVGACIHVPPPPPNQIIDVRSEKGVEIRGMFDAVQVTGTLAIGALPTELAEVGYRITADAVTPVAAEWPRSAFERYLSRRP